MISDLNLLLRTVLSATGIPAVVRAADVSFDRPSDTYAPQTTTVNLFLHDVRESVELRSSEPIIDRQDGIATIRRPPMRVACSYLVTTWTGADLTGDEAIFAQHELLGETLRVFAAMPAIPLESLTGVLATQPYPIPLATLQGDLTRNPAEFWSALGGKLRPSFTLTATIALMPTDTPVAAHLVSSSQLVVASRKPDAPEKDGKIEEGVVQIGGRITKAGSGEALAGVTVTLPALGRQVASDDAGKFVFSGVAAGDYALEFAKSGFDSKSLQVQVPGNTFTAFDVELITESH